MKFVESAVRFEKESNRVLVKYQLTVDGLDGIELRTVLEAMEVSFVPMFHLLPFVPIEFFFFFFWFAGT